MRPNALKRALSNLVMNAAVHGEHVEVAARARPQGGVEIVVDDDGPGIPPDRYEEAFKAFGRLDEARNQNAKGVGLGLAIARDVARGHGGDVTLDRSPLGGLRRGGAAAGLGASAQLLRRPFVAGGRRPLRGQRAAQQARRLAHQHLQRRLGGAAGRGDLAAQVGRVLAGCGQQGRGAGDGGAGQGLGGLRRAGPRPTPAASSASMKA